MGNSPNDNRQCIHSRIQMRHPYLFALHLIFSALHDTPSVEVFQSPLGCTLGFFSAPFPLFLLQLYCNSEFTRADKTFKIRAVPVRKIFNTCGNFKNCAGKFSFLIVKNTFKIGFEIALNEAKIGKKAICFHLIV